MADEEKQLAVDNWDDFAGVYMKAEDVKEWPLKVVPKEVSAYIQENKAKLDYVVEYSGRDRKIGINATNREIIKKKKLMPKDVIGKILVFGKIRVRNPSSNEMVDSFEILDILDN